MNNKKQNKEPAEIKQLEEQVKEFESNWKRAVADYRNLQKRLDREKKDFVKYANQRLLNELIPIKDALDEASLSEKENGLGLIVKQLDEILKKEGVEKISVGVEEKFSPDKMEAVNTESTDKDKKIDRVAKIYRPGYKYKNRVLRPAEVKVYTHK